MEVSREAPAGRLSEAEVAALVQRAVELDTSRGGAADLDLDAVRQVAAEVGISDAAFEQALAEWRDGSLVPTRAAPRAATPAGASATRVVRLSPGQAAGRIDAALDRQCFDRIRRSGAQREYVRRRGLVADLQRGLNLRGRMSLKDIPRLSVAIAPSGELCTRVTILVDLTGYRSSLVAGLVGAPLLAGAAVALGAFAGPDQLLVGLPIGVAAAGGGWAGAGYALAGRRARVEDALAGVLDSIA